MRNETVCNYPVVLNVGILYSFDIFRQPVNTAKFSPVVSFM